MNKKFLKLLLIFTILLSILTVTSFATSDDVTPTSNSETENNAEATATNNSEETSTGDNENEDATKTHDGDLYIEEKTVEITSDQYIAGNVYIKAKEVTISAPIDGNLFVQCDKLNINEAYIRNSIFASAKEIYYNGYCNDLYAICNKLDMTYNSYIVRNMNAVVNSDLIFKTAVGGSANISVKGNIDFGSDNDVGLVVGNLKLNTKSEVSVPEGIVEGEFSNDKNATKDIQVLEYMKKGNFFFDRYSSLSTTIILYVILAVIAVVVVACLVSVVLKKSKNKTKNNDNVNSNPIN